MFFLLIAVFFFVVVIAVMLMVFYVLLTVFAVGLVFRCLVRLHDYVVVSASLLVACMCRAVAAFL